MLKQFRFSFRATLLLAFALFNFTYVHAQDEDEPPPPKVTAIGTGNAYSDDEDDTKVTGATVRGRIFYEDTNRPVRFASVSLIAESGNYNRYSSKYVKTDENGEFVIRNVKPGTYLPQIKSDGVLTPETTRGDAKDENEPPLFEKITVTGLGEIQLMIRARRGGAISGRIQYADGEAAVGVKVELLRKQGGVYVSFAGLGGAAVGSAVTDDRGVYRVAGLPAGNYLVRVNEPFSHGGNKARYDYERSEPSSILKTYYPEGESMKAAKSLEIAPGQEQTAIDITLPERQLFTLAGKIVTKKDRQPLENFNIRFFKMPEPDEVSLGISLSSSNTVDSNKLGDWKLTNLPKGKYHVTVSENYVYRGKEQTAKVVEYPSITREIEITDKNLDDIVFEIPSASSLSGTIVTEDGKPLPKYMMLFAYDEKTKQTYSSEYASMEAKESENQANKPKAFRIPKMSGGNYTISLSNREFYIKSITFNARSVTNSPIEVGDGEDLSGVRIVVASDVGTIRGKVANYEIEKGFFAIVVKPDFTPSNLRSNIYGSIINANGEFEIKARPGEYAVILMRPDRGIKSEAESLEILRNLVQNAPQVTVKSKETVTVTVEMPK